MPPKDANERKNGARKNVNIGSDAENNPFLDPSSQREAPDAQNGFDKHNVVPGKTIVFDPKSDMSHSTTNNGLKVGKSTAIENDDQEHADRGPPLDAPTRYHANTTSVNLKERTVSFAQAPLFQQPSGASEAIKESPPLVNRSTKLNKLFVQPINN